MSKYKTNSPMDFSIIYKEIQNLISIFGTRELAYLSWLAIIICLIISSPKLRKSAWNVLRALFNLKFNIIYLLTLGHFYGLVYVLSIFGFWDKSLLKDTIYWVLLSASMLMYRIATNKAPLNFLKNAIKDNVKLSVFLSFIMTLATFNFWIEFIAIPILVLLVGMHTVAQYKKEHAPVRKILDILGQIASVLLLIYLVYFAIGHYSEHLNIQTLKEFTLPIILTILFIPFLAVLNLYVQYEDIATLLKRKSKNKLQYYQWLFSALIFFNFNIKGVIRWRNNFVYLNHEESLWSSMRKILAKQIKENTPPKHPELEGWNPIDAKKFLYKKNINIQEYDSNLGETWEGKSKGLKLSEDFMTGVCNYSIKGSKYVVHSLHLDLTCYDSSRISDIHLFLSIFDELYDMSVHEEIPHKIKKSILTFKSLDYENPYTEIGIHFYMWKNERKGYNLSITIRHKNLTIEPD